MKTIIAAIIATSFAMGTAFAQTPAASAPAKASVAPATVSTTTTTATADLKSAAPVAKVAHTKHVKKEAGTVTKTDTKLEKNQWKKVR